MPPKLKKISQTLKKETRKVGNFVKSQDWQKIDADAARYSTIGGKVLGYAAGAAAAAGQPELAAPLAAGSGIALGTGKALNEVKKSGLLKQIPQKKQPQPAVMIRRAPQQRVIN